MGRTGVTVDASVLAAAIRIDAEFKSHVRTIVVADDRFAVVLEKLRGGSGILGGIISLLPLEPNLLESVRGIDSCPSMRNCIGAHISSLAYCARAGRETNEF